MPYGYAFLVLTNLSNQDGLIVHCYEGDRNSTSASRSLLDHAASLVNPYHVGERPFHSYALARKEKRSEFVADRMLSKCFVWDSFADALSLLMFRGASFPNTILSVERELDLHA